MSAAPIPFADNWAYLKTELNWLERLLMVAVSRQRQEAKTVDRVAKTRADRATSHWWQGVVTLDGVKGYDDCRPPASRKSSGSYQQQLQARISATQAKGIILALPTLCDRMGLSKFEKSLILLTLAPEVNSRFSRLYRYLQSEDSARGDLPTVDLALRLLCRNDLDWRQSRSALTAPDSLVQRQLLYIQADTDTPLFLKRHLQLPDALVNYLLAPQPPSCPWALPPAPTTVQPEAKLDWSDLVVPPDLKQQLQQWGHLAHHQRPVLLFSGDRGTGKTLAAQLLAQTLDAPLTQLDLAALESGTLGPILQSSLTQPPPVLLIKSAHLAWGRQSALSPGQLASWLNPDALTPPGLTVLSVHHLQTICPQWRRQVAGVLPFPQPNATRRRQIWQRLYPLESPDFDWDIVARRGPLTGGEIARIAQTAHRLAQAQGVAPNADHLHQVLATKGFNLKKLP